MAFIDETIRRAQEQRAKAEREGTFTPIPIETTEERIACLEEEIRTNLRILRNTLND